MEATNTAPQMTGAAKISYIVSEMNAIIKRTKTPEMKAMKEDDEKMYIMKMEEEFPLFSMRYPSFFRKIVRGLSFEDMAQIAKFLSGLDDVQKGKQSMEAVEAKLGDELFKKHAPEDLYRQYKSMSPEQMRAAMEKSKREMP